MTAGHEYGPRPVQCRRCGTWRTKPEHLVDGKCLDEEWCWAAAMAAKAERARR
jgi:hypothetical protein